MEMEIETEEEMRTSSAVIATANFRFFLVLAVAS